MKLIFGIYVRHQIAFWTRHYPKKMLPKGRKAVDMVGNICANCKGCVGLTKNNYYSICIPYAIKLDPFEAENTSIPCAQFEYMEFKKI